MKVRKTIILIMFFVVCTFPILTCLNQPLTKFSTENALNLIEEKYINVEKLTNIELKSYKFSKQWILSNQNAAKEILYFNQKLIYISSSVSLICLIVLYRKLKSTYLHKKFRKA